MKSRHGRSARSSAAAPFQLNLFLPTPEAGATAEGPDEAGQGQSQEEWLQKEIGTPADWYIRTLHDIISLYYRLYDGYVLPFDKLEEQANGEAANAAPADKAHYRQLAKLRKAGRDKHYTFLYNLYGEGMTAVYKDVEQRIRDAGVDEDELDGLDEYFNGFFQHPSDYELKLTLKEVCDLVVAAYTDEYTESG